MNNATHFVALCNANGHPVMRHPASKYDLQRDPDDSRRRNRHQLLYKYPELSQAPLIDDSLSERIGTPDIGSNDWVDNQLLAAVYYDAVSYLVTEDGGIHRRAARLDLADRVLTAADAIILISTLCHQLPKPLPLVTFNPVHTIDAGDPILDSLRADYAPGFDSWFSRVKCEGREAFIIRDNTDSCAALCIVKPGDHEFSFGRNPLKVSTFKVADGYSGNRFGELLLKALFSYCNLNKFDSAWVTIFEKHEALISVLEQFGFLLTEHKTQKNELVLLKRFVPTPEADSSLSPLAFHIRFGPPALKSPEKPMAIIPIKPEFHRMLFPELESQQSIIGPGPFGNAIRKAYLSNAPIRTITPGDVLLFYRSGDIRAVTTIGIAERVLVSKDPAEVNKFVGGRTVYSSEQVQDLTRREVVAILFRQDRSLEEPISLQELVGAGVLRGAPQAICRTSPEVQEWLLARIRP